MMNSPGSVAVCERYVGLINASQDHLKAEMDEGNPTSLQHLLWMLLMIKNDPGMSITKRHRWLGYIQGVLVCRGLINVAEERDITRPLFNGE